MNMRKVRSLILFFLVVLNVVLWGFNWNQSNQYKVTSAREAAIIEVLRQNNIMLYTYMVKEFYPLSQIAIKPYDYDPVKMSALFFDGLPRWVSGPGTDKTVLALDEKTLTIYHKERSGFLFETPQGTGRITLNRDTAEAACQELLLRLNNPALNLKPDQVIPAPDGQSYTVEYRSRYENRIIYSSYARFRVTENGVVQLRGVFFEPDHFLDEPREIYSADEALYALIQELKNQYDSAAAPVKIDRMDVVYTADNPAESDSDTLVGAEPFYRVYISERPEQPFLINAYTNVPTTA